MGQDGDRPRGLAEGALVVLEREPVEPIAVLRGEKGVRAADLGEAVRVLDDSDRLTLGVATDTRRVPGDSPGLGGKERFRLLPIGPIEIAPVAVRDEHDEDDAEDGEHGETFESGKKAPPGLGRLPRLLWLSLVGLDLGGHPDVPPIDLDDHGLQPLLAAEVGEVGLLRAATARRRRGSPLAQAGDEEVQLERREGEEWEPERDRTLELRNEEPHAERYRRGES